MLSRSSPEQPSASPGQQPLSARTDHQGAIMPVKRESQGRRSVQVEVEVPGTAEEVWKAVATGPGGARVELSLADEADYVVAFAVLAR